MTTCTPDLVFNHKLRTPIQSIEINVDAIRPPHDQGQWKDLVARLTYGWLMPKKWEKNATLWMLVGSGLPFNDCYCSVMLAKFGFPPKYFEYLQSNLSAHLQGSVKFSDYVLPKLCEGWSPLLHYEAGKILLPADDYKWVEYRPKTHA